MEASILQEIALNFVMLLGGFSLGLVYHKHSLNKENEEVKQHVSELPPPPRPSIESRFRIKLYKNGFDEEAWGVQRRLYKEGLTWFYSTLSKEGYEDYGLPDFGGFRFVNLDDNDDDYCVGFVNKEDAESMMQTIIECEKRRDWQKVEE